MIEPLDISRSAKLMVDQHCDLAPDRVCHER
jgi:hypothetical protein